MKNKFDEGHAYEKCLAGEIGKYLSGAKIFVNYYLDENLKHEADIIAVHSSGIYLFEVKNYVAKSINGHTQDNTWTAAYKSGNNYQFKNPINQNHGHVNALGKIIPEFAAYIKPLVVFNNSCGYLNLTITDGSVVLRESELENYFRTQMSANVNFMPTTVEIITEKLTSFKSEIDKKQNTPVLHIDNNVQHSAVEAVSLNTSYESNKKKLRFSKKNIIIAFVLIFVLLGILVAVIDSSKSKKDLYDSAEKNDIAIQETIADDGVYFDGADATGDVISLGEYITLTSSDFDYSNGQNVKKNYTMKLEAIGCVLGNDAVSFLKNNAKFFYYDEQYDYVLLKFAAQLADDSEYDNLELKSFSFSPSISGKDGASKFTVNGQEYSYSAYTGQIVYPNAGSIFVTKNSPVTFYAYCFLPKETANYYFNMFYNGIRYKFDIGA